MLRVHLRDGHTESIDLGDNEQAQRLAKRLADPRFQAEITAMTITHLGVAYSMPKPVGFDAGVLLAEWLPPVPESKNKGGQRIVCLAGDVRATVMVHREQRAVRMSMFKIGKQRFNPSQP